jgi:signal transduction histidine kinase
MRLARKLTLSIVAGVLVVLSVHAIFAVRAEVAYSERSIKRDAHLTGHALVTLVADVWRRDGEVRALQMIDEANEEDSHVRIRWVWLNAREDDPYAPRAPRALLGDVALGREVTVPGITPQGDEVMRTYVPAAIQRGRPGALELSTSLALSRRYVSVMIRNTLITTAVMAAVCGALALLLGGWFVGRPIRRLVEKARRIGAGDLSGPLELKQRDEIGVLAEEFNAMCERLARARDDVAAATAAKIAMLEQLRHADRLSTVGKLASGIAHELGTPLNIVSGRARLIADGLSGDETRESAEAIALQAQRMTRIIRQLLDFARRKSVDKTPQDLRAVARQTVTLLGPLAEKRGVKLVVADGDDELPAEVDVAQLQQALTNLIVNGVQAMTRGGVLRVELGRGRARPPADHGGAEDEFLRVTVSDEGEGMSDETMAHIFEPFFTTKPPGEGTGLGLSVTYGIVKDHGGWIELQSRLGHGARFTVYLPEHRRARESITGLRSASPPSQGAA